jgi:hypothetical protein
VELIAPILVDSPYGFTGAQARIAPSGNPSGIPSGSLLFQNADGGGKGDLFVITEPGSAVGASYRPAGDNYFGGFDYNGGFDFDSEGRIFMGAVSGQTFAGEVIALVNLNNDEDIDAGEYNTVVPGNVLTSGIADLAIDKNDNAYCLTNSYTAGGKIVRFGVPENPLVEGAMVSDFAITDSPALMALTMNSKEKSFEPYSGPEGGIMILGGYSKSPMWAQAINLLTLRPSGPTGAKLSAVYE